MNVTATFDASSFAAMARLAGADIRLRAELEAATGLVAQDVIDDLPAHMNFQNPSGQLEGSFYATGSGLQREIGSGEPYAHRREFSFKGPASLGRSFPHDPA